MLVLSRKPGQKVLFPAINAAIQIVSVKPGLVRLGIEAPAEVVVLREELQLRPEQVRPTALPSGNPLEVNFRQLRHQLRNRLNGAGLGVALLRRQQELGMNQEARATLDKIEQELQGLSKDLDAAAPQFVPPTAPPRQRKTRKALLVEDDRNERELLAGFLRMAGMDVDAVEDGSDALNYLQDHDRPDVVLLDMGLPRCDGATTVREIRRQPAYADMKIFAVTGRSPEEFGGDGSRLSIDRWFAKPLNPQTLLQDLDRELACIG